MVFTREIWYNRGVISRKIDGRKDACNILRPYTRKDKFLMPLNVTPEQRFWKYLTRGLSNECWFWRGYKNRYGYGEFRCFYKKYAAHRFSYELHHGVIDNGMSVLHKCDNPACCNWAHLFLGTTHDNMMDKVKKGRQQRGEGIHQSKITEADVLEILHLRDQGVRQVAIATKFGISQPRVSKIIRREAWTHVLSEKTK